MAKNKNKNNKTITYILYALVGIFVIAILLPFLGGLISTINPNKAIQMAQQKKMENQNSVTQKIIQDDSMPKLDGWQSIKDSRGYTMKIPNNWYATYSEGRVQQTQNWAPLKYPVKGGSMQGDMSKWDVDFFLKPFTSENDILNQETEGMEVELIKKSQIAGGEILYLIVGTSSTFGNDDVRTPRIIAIIVSSDQYYSWYAIYSGNENEAKILEDIVKSIN